MSYSDAIKLSVFFAQLGILLRVIKIDEKTNNKQALLRIGLLDEYDQLSVKRVISAFNSAVQLFSGSRKLS